MGTEKTKVKGLDVFLQIMIAIFSLGWIGVYMPFLMDTKFGARYYGPESLTVLLAGIVFSVMVFVFVTFLSKKITATVVRVLFTFSFVMLMYQLTGFLGTIWDMLFFDYYRISESDLMAGIVVTLVPMVLILLMLCFVMTRQKHSGMFIGQVICLILLVVTDVLAGLYVSDEYNMDLEIVSYYSTMWTFHLMLALLSIWLRRRNYYRAQEECAAFGCPFLNGGFVPGMVAPAPIVTEALKPVDGIPCPVCGEICEKDAMFCGNCGATLRRKTEEIPTIQPVVFENEAAPTLEPTAEEEPATTILVEPVVEEEPATSILVEPVAEEEPATTILAEPVQEEAPAAPVASAPKAKFCSNCGTLLEEGTFFCCECGTKIEQ